MRDEHVMLQHDLTQHNNKSQASLCFTMQDIQHTRNNVRSAQSAPLIFKNESKLILATAAEKLLLSEAGTSSDTDDSQNNLDSSTTALF